MAELTVYSHAADGYIDASNATWATVIAATTGTAHSSDANGYVIADKSYGGGTLYAIARLFVTFDTSALPDNAIITAATISLYSNDVGGTDGIGVVQSTQANGDALVDDDFDNCGATEGATRVTSFTDNAYNVWTLNATGLLWISKTGYSMFCFRMGRDIDNTTPTGTIFRRFAMSETALTTSDPKLIITYTAPAGGAFADYLEC